VGEVVEMDVLLEELEVQDLVVEVLVDHLINLLQQVQLIREVEVVQKLIV
jgi:hypothetical protein